MAAAVRFSRLSNKKVFHNALPHYRRGFALSPLRMLSTQLKASNGTSWEQPLGLFINNEFVKSEGGDKLTTVNPYTEEDICEVFAAKQADVDKAVKAARAALKHPSWKHLSGTDRSHLMHKLADLVDKHADTLAVIETLDNGKPISASRTGDVPSLSETLRYYAGWADKKFGSVIDVGRQKMVYTLKQPMGVCGLIIAWNYPLMLSGWKLGPALACGNTVVLKLAEQTPLSMLYVAQLIREAGFPPGVINILNGYGREAGAALVRHPDVNKISFTGSTATGKEVMRMASETMKAITLETGGKSPMLVFDDADLEEAAKWAHSGIMGNQGQICSATSRILVHENIYDAFVKKLEEQTAKTSILGDPLDEKTFQGPQVSRVQYDRVMSYIESAKEHPATKTIHPGGGGVPSRGFFIKPTIFTNVDQTSRIFKEEIFGPCVAIVKFKTEAEALEIANATTYGLGSAVFTQNLARAHRVAEELEAGTTWINSSNDTDFRVPFGGYKQSGLGRELGEEGLRGYYQTKAVHVNMDSRV